MDKPADKFPHVLQPKRICAAPPGLIVRAPQVPRADARGYRVSPLRGSGATEWRHTLAPPARAGIVIATRHEPRRGGTRDHSLPRPASVGRAGALRRVHNLPTFQSSILPGTTPTTDRSQMPERALTDE